MPTLRNMLVSILLSGLVLSANVFAMENKEGDKEKKSEMVIVLTYGETKKSLRVFNNFKRRDGEWFYTKYLNGRFDGKPVKKKATLEALNGTEAKLEKLVRAAVVKATKEVVQELTETVDTVIAEGDVTGPVAVGELLSIEIRDGRPEKTIEEGTPKDVEKKLTKRQSIKNCCSKFKDGMKGKLYGACGRVSSCCGATKEGFCKLMGGINRHKKKIIITAGVGAVVIIGGVTIYLTWPELTALLGSSYSYLCEIPSWFSGGINGTDLDLIQEAAWNASNI